MPRIPKDATPDVQRSMKELWQELELLKRASITDMHGRRLSNTGKPKERRDYANKGYIDDMIGDFRAEVEKDIKRLSKLRTKGGGGTSLPPSGCGDFSFGYWYTDVIHNNGGGAFESEVKGYTNSAFVFDRDGGDTNVGTSDRIANLTAIIGRLAAAGFNLWLDVGPNAFLQPADMIQAAQAKWDKVKYILCGDEPDLTAAQANVIITQVKNLVTDAGLAQKPIGVTIGAEYLSSDIWDANWDFINIEAYTIPCVPGGCGASTAAAEIAAVKGRIDQMKSRIAATKQIHIVMQGYDRTGSFTNIPILAALNAATYFQMAKGDARVKGINIFAYARPNNPGTAGGGSQQHPELKVEHQKIWADCAGGVATTGASKKCQGDPRPCVGAPACCDGGTSNPCECPRLCEGGSYAGPIGLATTAMVAAHPELFVAGTTTFLSLATATQFRGYVTVEVNTTNLTLEAADDTADAKQVLVRLRTAPQFREDYAVWATDLTPRWPPGSYRATCWPGAFN